MRVQLLACLGFAWAAGCQQTVRYPPICQDAASGCLGTNPIPMTTGGGGDGGSDARTADVPEGGVIEAVQVQGVFAVSSVIPVVGGVAAPVPQDGWLITPVDAPMIAPVTTSDGGVFTLTGVPVVGGAYRLSATPPPGVETLRALFEAAPASVSVRAQFIGISSEALRSAATAGLVPLVDREAHLVVQLTGTAAEVRGLTVVLGDSTGHPIAGTTALYDLDGSTFSPVATSTGSLGLALFLNIAVPTAGAGLVVRVARGTVANSYSVTAYPGHAEWLPLSPP